MARAAGGAGRQAFLCLLLLAAVASVLFHASSVRVLAGGSDAPGAEWPAEAPAAEPAAAAGLAASRSAAAAAAGRAPARGTCPHGGEYPNASNVPRQFRMDPEQICRLAAPACSQGPVAPANAAGAPGARASARIGAARPLVGAAIALHPPYFHFAASFLLEYATCPAASAAMSIFLVFSYEEDMRLFERSVACLAPALPREAWTGVVPPTPRAGKQAWKGWDRDKQFITAYKKFYGLAHMMDLGADAPAYGLMLDAEISMFGGHSQAESWEAACDPSRGSWSRLLERIMAKDRSREFPAARVSDHLQFIPKTNTSGKIFDYGLIMFNAKLVTNGTIDKCKREECRMVKDQINKVLFSWWTDLPWMNLTVVGRMFSGMTGMRPTLGWRNLSTLIAWRPFEHIAYQQWCVLHEGFRFRDVTELTGEARWGSYLEEPEPGAQLEPLEPLWISTYAVQRSEGGVIGRLSASQPPLLVFHLDRGDKDLPPLKNTSSGQSRRAWTEVLVKELYMEGHFEHLDKRKWASVFNWPKGKNAGTALIGLR